MRGRGFSTQDLLNGLSAGAALLCAPLGLPLYFLSLLAHWQARALGNSGYARIGPWLEQWLDYVSWAAGLCFLPLLYNLCQSTFSTLDLRPWWLVEMLDWAGPLAVLLSALWLALRMMSLELLLRRSVRRSCELSLAAQLRHSAFYGALILLAPLSLLRAAEYTRLSSEGSGGGELTGVYVLLGACALAWLTLYVYGVRRQARFSAMRRGSEPTPAELSREPERFVLPKW